MTTCITPPLSGLGSSLRPSLFNPSSIWGYTCLLVSECSAILATGSDPTEDAAMLGLEHGTGALVSY